MTNNTKDTKKDQKKALLSQRICEIGESSILYPQGMGERHPYTQEVMLLADAKGYNQTEIGKICGVTQSMVSQWENNESKATVDCLKPLIQNLTPTAPGDSFQVLKSVQKTYKYLPDSWESDMLTWFCNQHIKALEKTNKLEDFIVSEQSFYMEKLKVAEFTTAHLDATLTGTLKKQQNDELKALNDNHETKKYRIKKQLDKLVKLAAEEEEERKENENQITTHQKQQEQYLSEREVLKDLPEEKLATLLERDCPTPIQLTHKQQAFTQYLAQLSQQYEQKTMSQAELNTHLEQQLITLDTETQHKRDTLKKVHEEALLNQQILGKYPEDKAVKEFKLSDSKQRTPNDLENIVKQLYSDQESEITLQFQVDIYDSGWNRDRLIKTCNAIKPITINFQTVYKDYVKSLPIKLDFEEVQICGTILLYTQNHQSAEDSENCHRKNEKHIEECGQESLTVYRLFNHSLLLVHRYIDHTITKQALNYLYIQTTADSLLEHIKRLTNNKAWDDTSFIDEWRIQLATFGYRLDNVRTIY